MGAVGGGQAGRVDDMVVGDKEEEEKDDKENEGGEDSTAAAEAELELSRLKELVPSVCVKDNVSQLDVILEAIRYISSLQGKLADRIEAGDVVPVLVNNT